MSLPRLRSGRLGLLLLLALSLVPLAPAQAGDRIWSAVVLATRENAGKEVHRKVEPFVPTLRKVFGYDTFYLLGQKTRDIQPGDVEWLVPSERIFLKVSIIERLTASYRMKIEVYDRQDLLVNTEAVLARDAPLYIRGPQWGKGQLVILLEVL